MEKLVLRVRRTGGKHVSYVVAYRSGMTVLDALTEVREKQDSTLGYRHSCRMGICGSCGMTIDGLPRLACQTQVSSLKAKAISIEPLHNMDVIKDLVVDIGHFFALHKSVEPYLIRKDVVERDNSEREYRVLTQEAARFLQFDYCVMCGLCYSACPTAALDPWYTGPQALAQAYRYLADPRDEGWDERVNLLDTSHGVWRCHAAGACSFVCPKDVDPAKAIQLARMEILKKRVLRRKGRVGARPVSPPGAGTAKQGAKAPPFDVEGSTRKI